MKTPLKIAEKKNLWFIISGTIIAIGIGLMATRALDHRPILNFGIDFTGGSSLILQFDGLQNSQSNTQFINDVRSVLKESDLEKSNIQISSNSELIIKTSHLSNQKRIDILQNLEQSLGKMELLEVDIIGPSIGEELRQKSIWIILVVSLALLAYITVRFQFRFGVAAICAVLHDALVTLSVSAILNIEINTAFVAAILTILGYSINDTIVLFDRIRENLESNKSDSMIQLINTSISQTLLRTINTSLTTIVVISCLLIFGGTTIKEFSLVLLIGIITGTYSSICIASPILLIKQKRA